MGSDGGSVTVDEAGSSRALPGRLGSAAAWLRGSRFGLFAIALLVGLGAGFGAIGFRYLIYGFTWLATGQTQFGQDGHVGTPSRPQQEWSGMCSAS